MEDMSYSKCDSGLGCKEGPELCLPFAREPLASFTVDVTLSIIWSIEEVRQRKFLQQLPVGSLGLASTCPACPHRPRLDIGIVAEG